jgi:hypothetical protein
MRKDDFTHRIYYNGPDSLQATDSIWPLSPPLPQPNLSPFRLQTGPRMRTVAEEALLEGGSQEVGGWGGLAGHLFPPLITNI